MSLGPLDLTGPEFLSLYVALLLAALVAGIVIARKLRPEGHAVPVTDVDQLAWLAGGRARFNESIAARLLSARALVMTGRDRFGVAATIAAASPAERSVLALHAPFRWREIELALRPHSEPLERRMTAAGLLMSAAERNAIRFWSTLPYLLLLAFGIARWTIGRASERPVGFLTVLLIVTAILALIRWFSVDRRTRAGRFAVARATGDAGRLRRAPTNPEVGLAVALFGTSVLVGSGWSDFHRLRNAGDGGGSSGGDGGCGGGGCGGGGCGG